MSARSSNSERSARDRRSSAAPSARENNASSTCARHATAALAALGCGLVAIAYHRCLSSQLHDREPLALDWPDFVVFGSAISAMILAAVTELRAERGLRPRTSIALLAGVALVAMVASRAPVWIEYTDAPIALANGSTLDQHVQRVWPWHATLRADWLAQRGLQVRASTPALCRAAPNVPRRAWPFVRRLSLERPQRFRALSRWTLDRLGIVRSDALCDRDRSTANHCCVDLDRDPRESALIRSHNLDLRPGANVDLGPGPSFDNVRIETATNVRLVAARIAIAEGASREFAPHTVAHWIDRGDGTGPHIEERQRVVIPRAATNTVQIELERGERLTASWSADTRQPWLYVTRIEAPWIERFTGSWSATRDRNHPSYFVFSFDPAASASALSVAHVSSSDGDRWANLAPFELGPVGGFSVRSQREDTAVVLCPDGDSVVSFARVAPALGPLVRVDVVLPRLLPLPVALSNAPASGPSRLGALLCTPGTSTETYSDSTKEQHFVAEREEGRLAHLRSFRSASGVELREVSEPLPPRPQCCVQEGRDELVECDSLESRSPPSRRERVRGRFSADCDGVFRLVVQPPTRAHVEGMTSTSAD